LSAKRYIWLLLFLVLALQLQGQQHVSTSRKANKRFQQARRCMEIGDLNCTEEALRKAIKADKHFIEAYQMLAQVYFDQGRLEEAIEAYSASLGYRSRRQSGRISTCWPDWCFITGDYERALDLAEHYLGPSPVPHKESGGS
jgi:Tfp pilus assembly protein PilF